MHPASCTDPTCDLAYVEHLRGFGVSAHATPTRRPEVVRIDRKEHGWDKDGDAYKTLRSQGYQPRHIDGCDRLAATATHDAQIES